MSYRVVADTNIFISATFWGGVPKQLVALAQDGTVTFLTTPAMIAEFQRVLNYPKFERYIAATNRTVETIVDEYRRMTEAVAPAAVPDETSRDRDDHIILACAVGGAADYIVTGDDDLLTLKNYRDIAIVTPAQLLVMLLQE